MRPWKLGCTLVATVVASGCTSETNGDETSSGPPPTGLVTYPFHRAITIAGTVPSSYSLAATFDHAALVEEGLAREDGADLRLGLQQGDALVELDRVLDPMSSWNSPTTTIWFRTPVDGLGDGAFALYFGKAEPEAELDDPSKVYEFWADFDGDSFDASQWKLTKFGGADGSFEAKTGALRLTGQSGDFAGKTDAGVFLSRSEAGDFNAAVAIKGVGGSLGAKAKLGGLMVRQSTEPNASFAMATLGSLPRQRMGVARAAKGQSVVNGTALSATDAFPQLLQLSRVGNALTASYSEDGRTWIGIGGAVTMTDLAPSIFLGIPFSNLSSDYGYADIDWFRVTKRVNPAPLVTVANKD